MDLAPGAVTDDRDKGAALAGPVGFTELAMLGLDETGGFLTASETDARGRATGAAFADATEPVGDATEPRLRTSLSRAGLGLAEADNEVLTGGAAGLVGTMEALRVGTEDAAAGLAGVVDAKVGLEIEGGVVEVFFRTGAVTFAVGGAGVTSFGAVAFNDPAPNVPELIIWKVV